MNDFERVKTAINLVQYIERQGCIVKREGANHKTRCIFHDDHDPSLVLYGDGGYKCFVCGVTGDVFNFAEKFHNWTKAEAFTELARYAGVTLEPLSPEHAAKQGRRERLYQIMELAAQYYTSCLLKGSRKEGVNRDAWLYVAAKRGLSDETILQARMGYAPILTIKPILKDHGFTEQEMFEAGLLSKSDNGRLYDTFRNRIMIPIRDHKGRIVAFSGRAIDGKQTPKYLHNATSDIFEKSKIVHRMPMSREKNAQGEALHTIVVVEGTIDPVSALNRGFYNIASIMGTSLTDDQLTLLCAPGVTRLVFCLDNDAAGHSALRRLVEKHMHAAAEKGVDLYAMRVPHGKDADDTLREKPELWQPAVDSARPVVDVLLERESASLALHPTPGQKQVWGLKVLPLLKGSNGFVNEDNLKKLAVYLNTTIATIDTWTQRQTLTLLPRHINAPMTPRAYPNLPTVELMVLHGILVNEDPQRWIDRANVVLGKLPYPKACGALSLNDFTDERTRGVMAMITTAISNGIRPFDFEVQTQIGNGHLHETYYRAWKCPEVQAVFASHDQRPPFVLSYDDFLKHVYRLRALRLKADITHKLIPGTDLVEWTKARLHLEQLSVKGWAI